MRDIDEQAGCYDEVECLRCGRVLLAMNLSEEGCCEDCEYALAKVDEDKCEHGLPMTRSCPQCHLAEVQSDLNTIALLEASIRHEEELRAAIDEENRKAPKP